MESAPVITRISNPSRQGFCAVYCGKDKVASVDITNLRRFGLARGVDWSEQLAREVLVASQHARARLDAERAIARRLLSRKQLIDRLTRKKHERAIAQRVADECVSKGLINDEHAAGVFARTAATGKPAGRRLIEAKLAQKGISRSLASIAAGEALAGHDPLADAMKLGRSKVQRFSTKLDLPAKQRRLFGTLARRGFEPDICRQVVERLLRNTEE